MEVKRIFVEKSESGRRFAISDIHGCSLTFNALLKQIALTKKDQLFLVGDLVNRGPQSDKVLDKILKLQSKGYQLYFIRGNHEQLVLNTIKKSAGQRKRRLKANKSKNLLEQDQLKEKYASLLKSSVHFVETEDYYIVHAGFNFKSTEPFNDAFSMMNIRSFKTRNKFLNGKKIVIGHQPKNISNIIQRIQEGRKKIFIDNGCVNSNLKKQGNLVCLNLDTLAISLQKNLDI